jgi:hypothetical protein
VKTKEKIFCEPKMIEKYLKVIQNKKKGGNVLVKLT